jgi:hypothetical protein
MKVFNGTGSIKGCTLLSSILINNLNGCSSLIQSIQNIKYNCILKPIIFPLNLFEVSSSYLQGEPILKLLY